MQSVNKLIYSNIYKPGAASFIRCIITTYLWCNNAVLSSTKHKGTLKESYIATWSRNRILQLNITLLITTWQCIQYCFKLKTALFFGSLVV